MSQLTLEFGKHKALITVPEIFAKASQELITELKEDRRLEKKSPRYALRDLGDYFSMWANTAPDGGVIVVGIKHDSQWLGCGELGQQRINEIETCGHTYCSEASFETKRIPITTFDHKSDFVIVIHVDYHPSRVLFTSRGEAFVRRGESKHKLTPPEINALKQEKGEINFEQGRCHLRYPDDFDQTAINQFTATLRSELELSPNRPDSDILASQHLGTIDGDDFQPNYACALLFAKDPLLLIPGCRITFLRFEGEEMGTGDKWNAVKSEDITGQVPRMIEEADAILRSQLRTFQRFEKGKFYTSAEYPHDAWYEAVVNACVHRSYSNGLQNVPIFIRMFDDRLEIQSPGPFPPFVTPENIYQQHHPRNPKLMYAMRFLRYVRCASEGTRRMRDTMLASDLPSPEFKQEEISGSSVLVTLRNNVKQRKVWVDADVADVVGSAIAATLSEDEKRAINHVAEYGEIGVSELARLTGGKSWPYAKKVLAGLADKRILIHERRESVDRDPKARYKLNVPRAPSPSGPPISN